MGKKNTNRWWEFYFVRYALGTIVGIFILILLSKSFPGLIPLLDFPEKASPQSPATCTITSTVDAGCYVAFTITFAQLTLYGIYGLVFCYISSAPILVFHGCRRFVRNPITEKLSFTNLAFLIIAIIPGTILFYYKYENIRISGVILSGISIFIILESYRLIFKSISKSKKIYIYLEKLSDKRKKEKTELMDSYKHLREHGNAFFIVLMEIMLAGCVFTISSGFDNHKYELISLLFFIWILPAAMTWCLGTKLEMHFSKLRNNSRLCK